MEIIIGRNANNGKLLLTVDGKDQQQLTTSGSVSPSVGTAHCKLTIINGQMRLRNLDINNYTYVNGQSIESKAITQNDQIVLGSEGYLLDWNLLKPFTPIDIRPLKKVWEDFEQQNIQIQIEDRKFNALRSATGIITMLAIALSIATGGKSIWYIVLYGIAIAISVICFIKAYRDSSKLPQKRQELNKIFQHDYVCPHCGHFMGNQPYDILAQNGCCPYCRKQFIH